MYLEQVTENGLVLRFEYHKVATSGYHPVAVSTHVAACVNHAFEAQPLPSLVAETLMRFASHS